MEAVDNKGENKHMEKKKEQKRKLNKVNVKTGAGIAALVAAVAVFVTLLQIQKNVLSEYEKGTVYVATTQVPKGEWITSENFTKYFKEMQLEKRCIPKSALSNPNQVQDLVLTWDIEEGVVLTHGMFETAEEILEHMEEPVIAGFKADDMYQVAGGVLRAGDRIHIYTIKDGAAELGWESVYVQQVFDATGESIHNEDKTSIAQRINVYLDKQDVEEFYSCLTQGNLRVVKVLQ